MAEIVREKVLAHTHAELPVLDAPSSSTSSRSRTRTGLMRLYCSILVERESQKPIVVGRGGEMIKRIGTEARRDLEAFFETRVFLDLRVKVRGRVARGRPGARRDGGAGREM